MSISPNWKLLYAARNRAAQEGEGIAEIYGFSEPPIDPFSIIENERDLIHAGGFDFGNAFDGRIKYVGPRFLISYNTKYNKWQHSGRFHTKILFTVAHELGHFFLPEHREYLVTSKSPHGSLTEFTANQRVEQQADAFASGLLMPGYLLRPLINHANFPPLEYIHQIRKQFQVSLTGLLVRWTQLSDFPCVTIAIKDKKIQYGWISKSLRDLGAYAVLRGNTVKGRDALTFIDQDPEVRRFRHATGNGAIINWVDFDQVRLLTEEHFFAIPHTGTVWVIATADENDLNYGDYDS